MDSKKKTYKAEAEFEKSEFSDLIDAIRNIKEEKVSEEFDNKLLSELDNINVSKTFFQNLLYAIRSIKENHPFKVYTITAVAAIILLIFIVLPLKETKTPDKILSANDSVKLFTDQKPGNIEKESLNKSDYLKSLIKDLESRYGLSMAAKENPYGLVDSIMEGEIFRKSIESRENLKRSDTLKLLFKIISEKKNIIHKK